MLIGRACVCVCFGVCVGIRFLSFVLQFFRNKGKAAADAPTPPLFGMEGDSSNSSSKSTPAPTQFFVPQPTASRHDDDEDEE